MILLSDNDLVIKLAQCNLIEEALFSLNASASDCYVLNTFQYSLSLRDPDKSIRKYVGSVQAYDRICELVGRCNILAEGPIDFELIEHMEQIPQIDPGEFALFLHARYHYEGNERFRILTGDKKALSAICNYEEFDAFSFLTGNVCCMESTLIGLINNFGFDYVNERVIVAKSLVVYGKYDGVLRSAFGMGRDQAHCTDCLTSFMSGITRLFNPDPS